MEALSVQSTCAVILICGIWTTDALALTTKNFQGECIGKYKSWKKQGGYGAAAIAKNGHCGFSWGYGTAEEARKTALSSCRFGGKGKGCIVVSEKTPPPNSARTTVLGTAETLTLKVFQERHKLSVQAMRERFGGVGRIACPWGTATTFLIADSDIFITSDHLFLSMEKNAPNLGRADKCRIEFFYSKGSYKIKKETLIHGFRTNKKATESIKFDWAVGKLDHPVDGVQPYKFASDVIGSGKSITMVSQGTNDTIPRTCVGNVSATLTYGRLIEFTTNCGTGPGTSGGPIIAGRIDSFEGNWHSVVGITRGYTKPYYGKTQSPSHVAIPVDNVEIRDAIDSLLKSPTAIQ